MGFPRVLSWRGFTHKLKFCLWRGENLAFLLYKTYKITSTSLKRVKPLNLMVLIGKMKLSTFIIVCESFIGTRAGSVNLKVTTWQLLLNLNFLNFQLQLNGTELIFVEQLTNRSTAKTMNAKTIHKTKQTRQPTTLLKLILLI